MNKKMIFGVIIICLLIMIIPFSFIISQEGNENEDHAFDYSYKIGTVQTLTGELSYQGKSMLEAIELYFDIVNENGGLKGEKVKIISYDDGYNPSIALEKTKKLVEEDNVSMIIGGTSASTALSVIDYINKKGITYIHMGCGSVELLEKAGRNVFFIQPTVTMEAMIMAEFAYNKLYASNLMVVYQNDPVGLRSRNALRYYADLRRFNISSEIKIESEDVPFHILLSEIVNNRPDAVIFLTYMSEAHEVLKFIRGHSIDVPAILPSYNLDYVSIGTIGKEAWNNTYTGRWFKSPKSQEIKDFISTFKEKKLKYPNMYHSMGWLISDVLAEGHRKSSYSGGTISGIKSIYSWDSGISTRIDYDNSYNVGIDSMYFVGFKDGRFFEYNTYITPDIIAYYNETATLGKPIDFSDPYNYFGDDKDAEEIYLDKDFKDPVSLIEDISDKIKLIEEYKESDLKEEMSINEYLKTHNNNENDDIQEPEADSNKPDTDTNNYPTKKDEAEPEVDLEYGSPIAGDDFEEEKIESEIKKEAEKNQTDTVNEIQYNDDLYLLLGTWKSNKIGANLEGTKYDGEITLKLKEDNRYYMDITTPGARTNNYNGYWEIKELEGDEKIIFMDQFIPVANYFKAYFQIINYGRTLRLIIKSSDDLPSLGVIEKFNPDEDYSDYSIEFNRNLE